MTNGELFIVENPNIEFKLNGSCVWIYFDGVNHYTMPTLWWEQEISLFDKIRAKLESATEKWWYGVENDCFMKLSDVLQIINSYKAESEGREMAKCDYCQHVEMCGWRESLEEKGCDFFDDGNKWIPVSERLPEENKAVIASTEYGVYPEARYTKEYGWEWAYESGADYWEELEEVKAWMPLPELYKPESEEE